MSEEEKEAIKMLEDIKNNTWTTKYIMSSDSKNAEIILNMIKKKDKIIYEMAKAFRQDDVRSVEEIIKYFERKSEE